MPIEDNSELHETESVEYSCDKEYAHLQLLSLAANFGHYIDDGTLSQVAADEQYTAHEILAGSTAAKYDIALCNASMLCQLYHYSLPNTQGQ